MDDQHHQPGDIVNRLSGGLVGGAHHESEDIQDIIGEPMDYSVFHFAEEETLMREAHLGGGPRTGHRAPARGGVQQDLVVDADLALYEAKRRGRNQLAVTREEVPATLQLVANEKVG